MATQINVSSFSKSEVLSGIFMIVSFVLAVFLSNVELFAEFYKNLVFLPVSLSVGPVNYSSTFISFVNDGLMSLFFLLIGLELKYHLILGEYQKKKTLILPALAAVGGIVIPAAIYIYFNIGHPTLKGWAIPIASDTAFMLGVLSFFSQHVSAKLRAFIISFSLIDDLLAIIILALFYTKSFNLIAFGIAIVLLLVLILLNFNKVDSVFFYLVIGFFLWVAMVETGIHGTISGAILALTIPVKNENRVNPSFRSLENILRPLICYFILPLFVLLNSGIRFDGFSLETLLSNVSLGIILGLFFGKQLGIAAFSFIGIYKKWCILPTNTSFLQFYGICILAGIGFTLSFFIGDLTFEASGPHYAMRSGVIIGSLLSVIFGVLVFSLAVYIKNRNKA